MSTQTTHYGLKKPEYSDTADIKDINDNMDDVDAALHSHNEAFGIVEDGDTATQNIDIGQYVIWKGALYKASAAIASGATLSASNLTAVTGGGMNGLETAMGPERKLLYSNASPWAGSPGTLTVDGLDDYLFVMAEFSDNPGTYWLGIVDYFTVTFFRMEREYNGLRMVENACTYTHIANTNKIQVDNYHRGYTDGTNSNYDGWSEGIIKLWGLR